jgi:uncharacterized protein YrzB (UPF0473 family)
MSKNTCCCTEEEEVKDGCCTDESCCSDDTCCSDEACDCGDDCGCEDDSDDACGCGCDHDHDHEMQTITLKTEEGEDLTCLVIGTFEVDEKAYIALLPEGEEDVFIYGYSEEGDEVQLDRIETDEEYARVGEVFMQLWGDEEEE